MPFPSQIPSPPRRGSNGRSHVNSKANGSSGSNDFGSGGFTVSSTDNDAPLPNRMEEKMKKTGQKRIRETLAKYKIKIGKGKKVILEFKYF